MALEQVREKIIIPSAVLGEIDYLLRSRLGRRATLRFLSDIYAGLNPGLCDAAVIALAERLKISTILTVDERDFRVIRSAQGGAFRLLLADPKKR